MRISVMAPGLFPATTKHALICRFDASGGDLSDTTASQAYTLNETDSRGAAVDRTQKLLLATVLFVASLVLTNCNRTPPIWAAYDECALQGQSFLAMAECGKQKRLAECIPNNSCSAAGTAFMQYVDGLALSVKNKEMTEAEGLRRYAEYKSNLFGAARRDAAIVAAGDAASGPKTCVRNGNIVNCF